jgi:hypothetical protein
MFFDVTERGVVFAVDRVYIGCNILSIGGGAAAEAA